MKSFKTHISEEWVDSIKTRYGKTEIWKNPTSREWKEFINSLSRTYSAAGIFHRGNVYVFDGGNAFHENVMLHLKIKNGEQTLSFRLNTRKDKIREIEFAGSDSIALNKGTKKYATHMKNAVKLYNHKSIKPHTTASISTTLDDYISYKGEEEFEKATGISV